MSQTLDTATAIAREAGALLRGGFRAERRLNYKSRSELVTDMDVASERLIVERLAQHYPAHHIITEEGGGREQQSRSVWLIDPLDGTNNYAHGNPFWSVSIALVEDGELAAGVVYAPMFDECFTAERGGPALLNGAPITVSTIAELRQAQLSTGFPYERWSGPKTNLPELGAVVMRCQDVRRLGSAALDLCYVADGRNDGHWEVVLKPWDSAAAALILQRAGGAVTLCDGSPYSPFGGDIVASNGRIQAEILAVLAAVKAEQL
jgi:myo-inositol-1(or 4)-monophosphatase